MNEIRNSGNDERDSSRSTLPDLHDVHYPEGDLKAWSVVLGAWCAVAPAMGLLDSLGTLHAWTSTHQLKDYSESSIGLIYGVYTFFLFLGGAQFGIILHRPLYVVVPGSVGKVLFLGFLSLSEAPRHIQCPRWDISKHPFYSAGSGSWVLVQYTTCVGDRRGPHSGRRWRMHIPPGDPFHGSSGWVHLVDLNHRFDLGIFVHDRMLHGTNQTAPNQGKCLLGFQGCGRYQVRVCFSGCLPRRVCRTYLTSYALDAGFDEQMSYAVLVFLNLDPIFSQFLPACLPIELADST
ncbi:hypothetical protein N7492_002776 [Penicillium capsulatum]|uniref:Uncharacterized protein n=1 Tax=Penicillium capsulatum TaxID=69766 RepID=A0A9W9IPR3_9EURO|nr:hypothetical protein N7492_002776 [Penicillium capsulatum]